MRAIPGKTNETTVAFECRVNHILYQIGCEDGHYKAQWLSGTWHCLRDQRGKERRFDSLDDAIAAIREKESA